MITFNEKDFGGNYIPVGESLVTVTKAVEQSSQAGNPVLYMELIDKYGRTGKEFLSLSDKARFRVAAFAVAAGLSKDHLLTKGLAFKDLVGRKLLMVKTITGKKVVDNKEFNEYDTQYHPAPEGTNTFSADEEIPF